MKLSQTQANAALCGQSAYQDYLLILWAERV